MTVIACLLVIASTVPIAMSLGVDLVPRDDQSEFQITFITPEGYTLDRTNRVMKKKSNSTSMKALPGVEHYYTVIGESSGKGTGDVTRGSIYLRMINWRIASSRNST